jgi:hypothetical protein
VADLILAKMMAGEPAPEGCKQNLPPEKMAKIERYVKALRFEDEAGERSLGGQVRLYLDQEIKRAEAGQISRRRLDIVRSHLQHFRNYVGDGTEVTALDHATLNGFYHDYCLASLKAAGGTWGPVYASNLFKTVKQFWSDLAQRGVSPLPSNFHRRFRFEGPVDDPTVKR